MEGSVVCIPIHSLLFQNKITIRKGKAIYYYDITRSLQSEFIEIGLHNVTGEHFTLAMQFHSGNFDFSFIHLCFVIVAVTQVFWRPRGLLVDQFDSKDDLIDAVFTSSFIPG